ncbi:MAG: anti-sigma F factor [Eubacteriales bacterium]|nr:anti-sigma F factor [Eubacteriales bacterium]
MNVTNEFRLVVDSKSINESFCRMVVSAFAGPLDPTIEELTDLKTAVSEAVTNCIVHAYANTCGKIYITGQLLQDNIIKIKIKDNGLGIENIQKAMTPLFTTGSTDRAGLGFTVMQSFCDRVRVSSSVGRGTTVTLTKKINGRTKW